MTSNSQSNEKLLHGSFDDCSLREGDDTEDKKKKKKKEGRQLKERGLGAGEETDGRSGKRETEGK